jgi:hypothetical protein
MLFLFCANAEDAPPEMNRTNNSEAMLLVIIMFF